MTQPDRGITIENVASVPGSNRFIGIHLFKGNRTLCMWDLFRADPISKLSLDEFDLDGILALKIIGDVILLGGSYANMVGVVFTHSLEVIFNVQINANVDEVTCLEYIHESDSYLVGFTSALILLNRSSLQIIKYYEKRMEELYTILRLDDTTLLRGYECHIDVTHIHSDELYYSFKKICDPVIKAVIYNKNSDTKVVIWDNERIYLLELNINIANLKNFAKADNDAIYTRGDIDKHGRVVTGTVTGDLFLYDIDGNMLVKKPSAHVGTIAETIFVANDSYILSTGFDRRTYMWNSITLEPEFEYFV